MQKTTHMPVLSDLLVYKLSPGGNTTLLVHDNTLRPRPDTPAATHLRAALAVRLMRDGKHADVEQVGFLDTTGHAASKKDATDAASLPAYPHMEMMGGEFCVNACRSAALVFALTRLLPKTACNEDGVPILWAGHMTTSGLDAPLPVRVCVEQGNATTPESAYEAAVALPFHTGEGQITELAPGKTLIRLPGITHLLLDTTRFPQPEDPLYASAAFRREHMLEACEAAGVIWYAPGPDNTPAITPVVWVQGTNSTILETACGSGSLALALQCAPNATETAPFIVRQPSGDSFAIWFTQEDTPLAWINGPVRLLEQSMISVDSDS